MNNFANLSDPPFPSKNPGAGQSPRNNSAGGPVIAGRLTIERNKNGHRTGQVPEIWGEWEFPLRAYLPGGFRLTIVLLRVP